jgi:predicted amidophosphoribosyltransferase
MQFDTVRPAIAELLYQLKYKRNQDAAAGIISAAVAFLQQRRAKFDVLIPVPPSAARTVQPVLLLAHGIGAALGLPMINCITTTRPALQFKGVTDPVQRELLVAGLYAVDRIHTAGKKVLLFDDLFRSGATMNAITDLLLQHGEADSVHAVTITKTRSNQ